MKNDHKHFNEDDFQRLCDYLGEDLESDVCSEVRDNIEACPTCKLYFDSVRKMVEMYRNAERPEKTPEDCRRKILDLIARKASSRRTE